MWNESEHPRDEDGKFTFKNEGNSGTITGGAADIIYHDSKVKEQKDRQENEYKSKLLDILGDKATPTDVLYGTVKQLEEKVRNYRLQRKFKGASVGAASDIKLRDIDIGTLSGPSTSINNNNQSFTRPVEGKVISEFGPRKAPVPNGSTNHKGIDFRAPIGTPVKSVASGTVIKAGSASGYGIAVYVDHGVINGKHVVSEYGHLSKCNVKVGDKINAGQVVAKSGNSGRSSGPHLHLTIKENGKAVDPKKYIKLK